MEEPQITEENSNDVGIPGLEVPIDINQAQNNDEIVIDDTDSIVTENSTKLEVDNVETNDQKTNMSYNDEDDDDDVIIHEVVPERIVLDDDDFKEESYPTYEPTPISVKKEPVDDDGFMDVEDGIIKTDAFDNIQIKSEPVDTGTTIFINFQLVIDS